MCHNDIAITIYGWFGQHAETCLGVACFVSGDIDGYELFVLVPPH